MRERVMQDFMFVAVAPIKILLCWMMPWFIIQVIFFFNSDSIKNTSLIKGGMPAEYGGRLSSVLDVAMKDGNINKFQVEGGIGLIASRLSIQGPIKKDKASF